MNLSEQYKTVREATEAICKPLQTEDYVVQPIVDVSPPKWHLGHTTWFYETFILKQFFKDYKEHHPDFHYVFNSYYETLGARVLRTNRGNLTRPTVAEVYKYRAYVDEHMYVLLRDEGITEKIKDVLLIGLNHEQQHQELLYTDIKYILGHNPLFPAYTDSDIEAGKYANTSANTWIKMPEGTYDIGFAGETFCYDNEQQQHRVFLHAYEVSDALVTNGEYLEFINAGGYNDFKYWYSDGWEWVRNSQAISPLYWYLIDGEWCYYTYRGLQPVDLEQPVMHVNFYEASAYAAWKGLRLPTEFEWEAAAQQFNWGDRWEWTNSAYLPYPGYTRADGAIGEYNGKFMVNQMVLRGASVVTPVNHSRITYRNFFQPHLQWQFTGIRLAH